MSRRLLLVDDSDAVRMTTAVLLEDAGFEVVEAGSLAQARQRLVVGQFVLAVVDVHLEDGLGSELIAELRSRQPGAAVVLLTGSLTGEDVSGADAVLTKGMAPAELVTRLEAAIAAIRR